jgi:hypothetical protein
MALSRRLLALVLSVLLMVGTPLYGWDNIGHMAVAYVAYQHLNSPTKARINTLLKLNPDYHYMAHASASRNISFQAEDGVHDGGDLARCDQAQAKLQR